MQTIVILSIQNSRQHAPVCFHLFVVKGIAYFNDPDSYAGSRVVILLVGPPNPDRLKDRCQTK